METQDGELLNQWLGIGHKLNLSG